MAFCCRREQPDRSLPAYPGAVGSVHWIPKPARKMPPLWGPTNKQAGPGKHDDSQHRWWVLCCLSVHLSLSPTSSSIPESLHSLFASPDCQIGGGVLARSSLSFGAVILSEMELTHLPRSGNDGFGRSQTQALRHPGRSPQNQSLNNQAAPTTLPHTQQAFGACA